MNCQEFAAWLVQRKTKGLADAESAVQHAMECDECRKKLDPMDSTDAMLLTVITQGARKKKKQEKEPVPFSFDVNMALSSSRGEMSRSQYRLYGVIAAVIAVGCVFLLGLLLL